MKNIFLLFFSLSSITVFGQLEIKNNADEMVAWYDTTVSSIKSTDSVVLLHFDSNGDIFDSNNDLIGHFSSSTGEFIDLNNAVIGTINESGEVKNSAQATLGNVENDGSINDSVNNFMIANENIDKYKLAYLFFFSHIFN